MLTKPRAQRVESMTQPEIDVIFWLTRLSVCLKHIGDDLPAGPVKTHVRKTIGEFTESSACSDTLEQHLRT